MGEPTWTTIRIGGTLPASKIAELLETAESNFFSDKDGDWDEEAIRTAADESRSILLQGVVNYGNPEVLVDFCKENKLPFWLHFDGHYEWDPGIEIWKPDDEIDECQSDRGQSPVITLDELRQHLSKGGDLKAIVDVLECFETSKVPAITIIASAAPTPATEAPMRADLPATEVIHD